MNKFERIVLNAFFVLAIVIILFVLVFRKDKINKTNKIENYNNISIILTKINKKLIEVYEKNYNYQINNALISKHLIDPLKNTDFINKINIVIESEELKKQTQSDLIMTKKQDNTIFYENVPNEEQWRKVTYKNWYENARKSDVPTWSSVYYIPERDNKLFSINYTIPIHNRSEEGGNAFLVNIEINGNLIKHKY